MGSLAVKAVGLRAQLRFSQNRMHTWAVRLMSRYVAQPYDWFLNRHSANLGTAISVEVQRIVNGALFPTMQLIAHRLTAMLLLLLLLLLLVAVDPFLAMAVGLGMSSAYWFI